MSFIKKYRKRAVLLSFLILGLSIAWNYYDNRDVIATVGSLKIREAEFKQELSYRGGDYIDEVNKKELLDEMIEKKLLLNKAYSLDLDKDSRIKREYEYLLMGEVRKHFIEEPRSKIKLEDQEFKEYYNRYKESFKKPEKRSFAILFFSKRRNSSIVEEVDVIEKLNKIQELYQNKKLPNPKEGFGEYAIENSEHQVSRYKGGIIGWFHKNNLLLWEEKVLKAGFKLKHIGDMSDIIETDKGFYLIRFVEEEKSKYISFEKVKNQIRYKLIKEKQLKLKKEFTETLLKEFSISINSKKLDNVKNDNNDKNHSTLPFKDIF